MAGYHHRGHSVTDCKYHLIWVTKYRDVVRTGEVAARCRGPDPRDLLGTRGQEIVRAAVSPDHLHLLVAAPPPLAPAKLVQYLKG